nr:hypothetical protein [Tanacetum cinerariifolium]
MYGIETMRVINVKFDTERVRAYCYGLVVGYGKRKHADYDDSLKQRGYRAGRNNGVYPVAYAIVEAESKSSWLCSFPIYEMALICNTIKTTPSFHTDKRIINGVKLSSSLCRKALKLSWMVNGVKYSKTVGGILSEEHVDYDFIKIVTNRGDSHILLFKPRRQEVQEFYDLKRNIYIFLWKGKRIAMISSKEQVHVPMAEVKIEENILKTEVVEEHVENIKDLQVCELHEDKIANLVVSTKEVVVLKNCENKVLGSKDEERVEGLIIGEVNQDSNMDLDKRRPI